MFKGQTGGLLDLHVILLQALCIEHYCLVREREREREGEGEREREIWLLFWRSISIFSKVWHSYCEGGSDSTILKMCEVNRICNFSFPEGLETHIVKWQELSKVLGLLLWRAVCTLFLKALQPEPLARHRDAALHTLRLLSICRPATVSRVTPSGRSSVKPRPLSFFRACLLLELRRAESR